jgi:hypothetical protein
MCDECFERLQMSHARARKTWIITLWSVNAGIVLIGLAMWIISRRAHMPILGSPVAYVLLSIVPAIANYALKKVQPKMQAPQFPGPLAQIIGGSLIDDMSRA